MGGKSVLDPFFFRPLRRSDFPLLERWLREPQVQAWWHEPLDLTGIEIKYGPRVDGIEPTHVFIIESKEEPLGLIQWYRWADYPEHARQLGAEPNSAGLDLALGEKGVLGLGLGPAAIRQFLREIVFADPTVLSVIADPQEDNRRSLRAFEKAGFTVTKTITLEQESFRRCVVRRLRLPPHENVAG
jgi:aminoglycoside 6'-N-acetyltransferase